MKMELKTNGLSRRAMLGGMTFASLAVAGGARAAVASGAAAAFEPSRWWEQDFRIVQTNLREIDVRHDPRKIAREVRDFGANVLVSNVGGIVAFYPTKLEFHYRNPYLEGDFVGAQIEAAREEGLAYVGRFDVSKGMKPAYDAHPEWFVVNRDGTPREFAGTFQACPNGGWAQEYAPTILREALAAYRYDGVFFNLGGFLGTDYANVDHGICVCENCARAFRDRFKRDLPKVENFSDPAWRDYLTFQEQITQAGNAKAKALVADLAANVPILHWSEFDRVGRGEAQRRVWRPAPEWQYQSGEQCRMAMAHTPGKAWSSTSAAHIDYPWRQVTETADYHLNRFAQMLGVGAKLDLYLMGTLADQNDPSYLPPVSDLYKWEAKHSVHYHGLQQLARVGYYFSEANKFAAATPYARYVQGAGRGAYSALVDSRIPFQFVSGARAGDGSVDLRKAFDVIVAPNVMLLPPAEAAALDRFVLAGGLLIASGMFGAFDGEGRRVPTVEMQNFPTRSYAEPIEAHGWSLDPTKGSFRFAHERIPVDALYFGGQLRDGVTSIIPFAPDQPFGPPELSYATPEAPVRDMGGVLVRAVGKGRVVHIPWLFDWQYYRDGLPIHQRLLQSLIAEYGPAARWTLTGDGAVELTAQRTATGRTLLHIINYSGQRNGRYDPAPKLHGLRLSILGDPPSATALVAGQDLAATRASDGKLGFDLPPVGAFEALLV